MQDLTIGSLSLIANFTPSGGILVQTPIEGLDAPNYRNNTFSNPGRHGVTMSSQYYDGRIINLTGTITASNALQYEQYRSQLSQATQIQKDSFGYPVPARMTFTTMAGAKYYVDIKFDKPYMPVGDPNFCKFQVTGTVERAFIFGQSSQGFTVYPPTAGGRITPTVTPYTTTSSNGGNVNTFNNGTETAFPVINVYGSITNPVITNTTTGKVMRLNLTVNAGDILTIDMYNQTVVLNSSSSQISAKTIESDWWGVQPGLNVISLSTGSTSDTGYISGIYNPPYVGI